MSDGRMWLNSRSWCSLNLNNISLYFLHSRLNMTPVVYRFLSLFAVFPFDFLSASPKLTQLTWEINLNQWRTKFQRDFFGFPIFDTLIYGRPFVFRFTFLNMALWPANLHRPQICPKRACGGGRREHTIFKIWKNKMTKLWNRINARIYINSVSVDKIRRKWRKTQLYIG
jgi:hypothetical protein